MKALKRFTLYLATLALVIGLSGAKIAPGATITVTSPNGGETWAAGTMNVITWNSDTTCNVRITLLKAGVQFALIASNTPNDGTQNWTIPPWLVSGSDYTVKISACINPAISDVSDAPFTITGAPVNTVAVTSPNGGEVWTTGTTNTITWTSNIVGNVRIALLKNGIQRALISSGTPNDGTHSWLIPAGLTPGADYKVKISSLSYPYVSDISDAVFTINMGGGTIVTLTSPNGGETWTAGTTNTITWTSDIAGYVRIVLLKGGIQCALIASGTQNDGTQSWLVPAGIISGTDYTVKISSCINPLLTDVSDSNFTINGIAGSIVTVTAPNGGEIYTAGTANLITWTSDIVGNVKIVLLKGGVHFSLISASTPNDGSHSWLIPAGIVPGADYTVKITGIANPLVGDVSDANFTINAGVIGTAVTVTSPNGGESWIAGTPNMITWISDITGNVRIVLLKGGIQCALIASGTPNDSSHAWIVPAGITLGTDYTVRISSCINPLLFDISDSAFSIVASDASNQGSTENPTINKAAGIDGSLDLVVKLYPNPATDKITISADRSITSVSLLNTVGQSVLRTTSDSRQVTLNVSEFNPGIYFVRVEAEGVTHTQKIVIK